MVSSYFLVSLAAHISRSSLTYLLNRDCTHILLFIFQSLALLAFAASTNKANAKKKTSELLVQDLNIPSYPQASSSVSKLHCAHGNSRHCTFRNRSNCFRFYNHKHDDGQEGDQFANIPLETSLQAAGNLLLTQLMGVWFPFGSL